MSKTKEELQAELDLLSEQEAALAAKAAEIEAEQEAVKEAAKEASARPVIFIEAEGDIPAHLYREHGRAGADSGERV